MRKSRPEEADLHISVLGVVPGGPWWRNITARGCEVSAAARDWARPVCWGRLCLPVSWEMRLLLRTSCREHTSHRKVLPRVSGRRGEGRGAERASCFSCFPKLLCWAAHVQHARCRVWGSVSWASGVLPSPWSTVSICAAPRTPPRLLSQPPAVRHKPAAGWAARSRSLPSSTAPTLTGLRESGSREILTFAKYCFEWPLCVSLGLGSFYSEEKKTFLSVSHSDS